mgnify:CR=1 FL=1
MGYFFDSYAIIEIVKGNPNYEKFSGVDFITNSLNLAEVYYYLLKESDEYIASDMLKKFNFEFIEIDPKTAVDSAIFRFRNKKSKLSYADCIGYVLAKENNLLFLTGDKEFENLFNVEFVKK